MSLLVHQHGCKIIEAKFEDAVFGNFLISYAVDNVVGSLVCDRGELYKCADLSGIKNCKLLLMSVQAIDERELLAALSWLSNIGQPSGNQR
jgi:hypothetical protein